VLQCRTFNEGLIEKDVKGSRMYWPHTSIFLEGLRIVARNVDQYKRSPGLDLNRIRSRVLGTCDGPFLGYGRIFS
jgi:hypothetical protein